MASQKDTVASREADTAVVAQSASDGHIHQSTAMASVQGLEPDEIEAHLDQNVERPRLQCQLRSRMFHATRGLCLPMS